MLTDESLMLDIDIIEKRHEEEIAALTNQKDAEIEKLLIQNNTLTSNLAALTKERAELIAELAALKETQK